MLADRLLLTKVDLAGADETANTQSMLSSINQFSPQIIASPEASIGSIFWPEALDLPRSRLGITGVDSRPKNPTTTASASLAFHGVLMEDALEEWLNHTLDLLGPRLLRMKAMLNVENAPLPTALHVVRGLLHRPVTMQAWPNAVRTNRIVLIAEDVDQQILVDALSRLAACAGVEVPTVTSSSDAFPGPVSWSL